LFPLTSLTTSQAWDEWVYGFQVRLHKGLEVSSIAAVTQGSTLKLVSGQRAERVSHGDLAQHNGVVTRHDVSDGLLVESVWCRILPDSGNIRGINFRKPSLDVVAFGDRWGTMYVDFSFYPERAR
jgi:hypothetical protein